MNCGCMRASTVRSRVLDRCGDCLGVESSFKDICILAAVMNDTIHIRPLLALFMHAAICTCLF